MSFETQEISAQDGAPIELYDFIDYATGAVWRYTNAPVNVELFDIEFEETYIALPVKRSSLKAEQELIKTILTITLPFSANIVSQYTLTGQPGVIDVEVSSYHLTDSSLVSIDGEPAVIRAPRTDTVTLWLGAISNVKFSGLEAALTCESITNSLKQNVLRRKYQRGCPHVLYSQVGCKVDKSLFTFFGSGTLTGVSFVAPFLAAQANGYFAGGSLKIGTNERLILSHVGDTVTVDAAFPVPNGTQSAFSSAGCDHTEPTCNTKFNNRPNYGGFAYFGDKNPMNGSLVF